MANVDRHRRSSRALENLPYNRGRVPLRSPQLYLVIAPILRYLFVMLYHLRHSTLSWLRRPIGRVAALLLVLSVMLAGMPVETVHAHADGHIHHTHHHHHHHHWDSGLSADSDEASAEHEECNILHAHDTGLSTTGILSSVPTGLVIRPAPFSVPAVDDSFPKPPLSSLYRPPIV